jgi:signal transduction histidine kinase
MPHGEGALLPIDRWFNRIPPVGRVAICVALVLLVGALDWLTGAEVSLLVFYAVPVALAAWTLGRAGGFAVAVASAATSILTTNVLGRTYHFEAAPYWEAVMVRLAFLLLVAELLTRLRVHWLRERTKMAERLVAADARAETETALRRSTVEQLRHADRLTTVGQLAAGLAHELGTPLNVVLGRAKAIASGEVTGQEALDNARTVAEQGERMARIIRHLLDFACRRAPHRSETDLRQAADLALGLLAPLAKKNGVKLRRTEESATVVAQVDADQIQQVLTNLVVNAIQAMPRGGAVIVDVRRVRASAAGATAKGEADFGRIDVRDEGPGIAADVLPKIFDPFFTTKGAGEGTGLGLSVADGIVREHGGWMEVESAPGKGSCFSIFLPTRVHG